jgi:alcohol dehydrogenase class IV
MTQFGALRLPGTVVFGRGQRDALGLIAAKLGRRALVCTDARLAREPQLRAMLAALEKAGLAVKLFDGTELDLPIACVMRCVEDAASFAPDLVIGIGGGSCMDMAKAVALMLRHGGAIADYFGENKVPGPILPVIAVPTTAGTGSEVTPVAVVSDVARNLKIGISSPHLIPQAALCDPELTLTCPPGLTAASGVDALTHAVEAFTAVEKPVTPELTVNNVFVGKNILSDQFALTAIANIWRFLKRAYDQGDDLEAREGMMLAALSAGCAFGTAGTAAAHAIQYPVGNDTHTPHGVGVATLLPYVMEFNRPNCVGAFAQIARTIGLSGTDEELSHAVIDAMAALLKSVGIPDSLRALGLAEDRQDWTAESAFGATRLVNNNPRKLDLEALRAITQAAFTGDRSLLSRQSEPAG